MTKLSFYFCTICRRLSEGDPTDIAQQNRDYYKDDLKLEKAFREDPAKMRAFIDGLPDPDMTTAGAEIGMSGIVCFQCITKDEKERLPDDESNVSAISRDEADGSKYICIRCGKVL